MNECMRLQNVLLHLTSSDQSAFITFDRSVQSSAKTNNFVRSVAPEAEVAWQRRRRP